MRARNVSLMGFHFVLFSLFGVFYEAQANDRDPVVIEQGHGLTDNTYSFNDLYLPSSYGIEQERIKTYNHSLINIKVAGQLNTNAERM